MNIDLIYHRHLRRRCEYQLACQLHYIWVKLISLVQKLLSGHTDTHTTDCSTWTTKLIDESMTLEDEIAISILSIHRAANLDSVPALCRHRLTIYFTSKFNCLLARVRTQSAVCADNKRTHGAPCHLHTRLAGIEFS